MLVRSLAALLGATTLLGCSSGPAAGPSSPASALSACGDGVVQPGEECDDANVDDADGCLATCYRPLGWVSGDPHLHAHGCDQTHTPDDLVRLMVDRDLNVGSVLLWGKGFYEDSRHFNGRDDRASIPGRILHHDLEIAKFPADVGGHLLLLGLFSIDFSPRPFDTPESGLPVVRWARAQGARVLVGMAHGEYWPADGRFPTTRDLFVPWEFPIHVALGQIDFLETETPGKDRPVDPGTFLVWSKLLNSGFRVPLVGASDYPCVNDDSNPRAPRTLAFLEGETTYEKWLDAIRRGRSVLSLGAGRALNIRVDGKRLGEEVRARAGQTLAVAVEGRFERPAEVRILANGTEVGRVLLGAGARSATARLTLSSSAWVVAQSPWSITSPVYVDIDERPLRASAEDACYWVRYVDHLARLVEHGDLWMGRNRDEALEAYAMARGVFLTRFAESGGLSCP